MGVVQTRLCDHPHRRLRTWLEGGGGVTVACLKCGRLIKGSWRFRPGRTYDEELTSENIIFRGSGSPLPLGSYISQREKEATHMSEQAGKISRRSIPEWAQGLYYNSAIMSEVLLYHDEESIYFEHKGKESGIVRYTFEMIEGLKIVEEEEDEDSQE